MKIVINEEDYGRVVRTTHFPNAYKIRTIRPLHYWNEVECFGLDRENALRLQEDLRLWRKEHPV